MVPSAGHKMKLYRNSGTNETPVWGLVDEVGDVSIPDFSLGVAELKRRANDYTKGLATLFSLISLQFRLHHGLGATMFGNIKTDFLGKVPREWAVLNGPVATVGTQGLRLPILLTEFPWDQNLEDVSGHDVKGVLAYMLDQDDVEIDPSWMTVSA